MSSILKRLTSADHAATYFTGLLFIAYVAAPLAIICKVGDDQQFLKLSIISFLAAITLLFFSRLPVVDYLCSPKHPRLHIRLNVFLTVVWTAFFAFVCLAWLTAEGVPILASISGADPETISMLRERFLKAREGWQSSFVYINAIFSGALIPYCIALMFLNNAKYKWITLILFLVYSLSFVEKAFFFRAFFPLFYLIAQGRIRFPFKPSTLLITMLGTLFLVTYFSGVGVISTEREADFFSANYLPQSPLEYLVWRSVAIPIVTAADAIQLFYLQFDGEPLWGATSSLLSGLFGRERVEFERLVFAAQWGQNETGSGSANSVYITESFVNFGWAGVVAFSALVGMILRMFAKSHDEAFRSLWFMFCFGVYTSGLIGQLFSNGFIIVFLLTATIQLKHVKRSVAHAVHI